MKKIKILALLAIVAFVVQDVVDGFRGATDGWQAAGDKTEHSIHIDLPVRPAGRGASADGRVRPG